MMEAPLLETKNLSKKLATNASKKRSKVVMSRIEEILEEHPQKTQYRDKKKKPQVQLEWSMLMGHTTKALGAKSFETSKKLKEFMSSQWK